MICVPLWPDVTDRGRRKRSEEHTSELQAHLNLVWRLLLENKKDTNTIARKGMFGIERGRTNMDRGRVVALARARPDDDRPGLVHVGSRCVTRFFFNDPASPGVRPLPLHDPLHA